MAKFGPKLAFLVNLGQAIQAYSVPCWWVGWWLWRAGCISQDTYLLYIRCVEMDLITKMTCCNSGRVGFRFDSLRQEKRDLAIDSRQNLLGSLLRPQK